MPSTSLLLTRDEIYCWNLIGTIFQLSAKFALQIGERRDSYAQSVKFKKASDAAAFIEAEEIKRGVLCEYNWKSHDFHLRIALRKQRVGGGGGGPLGDLNLYLDRVGQKF
jgi:hypothetical protein